MLRYLALAGLVLVCGCPGAATDAVPDGGSPAALTGCIERPSELPHPPNGRLPCELIPPSLKLSPEK